MPLSTYDQFAADLMACAKQDEAYRAVAGEKEPGRKLTEEEWDEVHAHLSRTGWEMLEEVRRDKKQGKPAHEVAFKRRVALSLLVAASRHDLHKKSNGGIES